LFYPCLIFSSLLHLKTLFNSFSVIILFKSFFLFVIYIIHLPVVRPRSCRVIYCFDTLALGIRHQLFDRVRGSFGCRGKRPKIQKEGGLLLARRENLGLGFLFCGLPNFLYKIPPCVCCVDWYLYEKCGLVTNTLVLQLLFFVCWIYFKNKQY